MNPGPEACALSGLHCLSVAAIILLIIITVYSHRELTRYSNQTTTPYQVSELSIYATCCCYATCYLPLFLAGIVTFWASAFIYTIAFWLIPSKNGQLTEFIKPLLIGFPSGSVVKNPPTMQETQVQSLGGEEPLEKEMATHSGIFVWEIPWTDVREIK